MQLLLEVVAVVPHAPVLLPELESPRVAEAAHAIRAALRTIDTHRCRAIVVVSPHGSSTGVYKRVAGSLKSSGLPGIEIEIATDPVLARELSEAWDAPLLDDEADHGIVVPLALGFLPEEIPVVGVTIAEHDADPITAGLEAAEAVRSVAAERPIGAAFSAHTSSSLTERAPVYLHEDERAQAVEDEVDFLESLSGDDRSALDALTRMSKSYSCSMTTLAGFCALAGGAPSELLAYEKPLGVGYLVQVAYAGPTTTPASDVSDIARL